jgi:hypothetical protein
MPTHIIPLTFGHHGVVYWHTALRMFGKGEGNHLVRPLLWRP